MGVALRKILTILLFLLAFSQVEGRPLRISPDGHGTMATGGGYSIFLPIVGTAVGSTTFYTSIDVTNTTDQSVDVSFFFFNTNASIKKSGHFATVGPRGNFHRDDLIEYLVGEGVLSEAETGAPRNIFGSLYLTFESAAFTEGTEGSAVARIYNYAAGTSGPTLGQAYRADVLRDGAARRVSSILRSTAGAAVSGPVLRSNIAFQNKIIDENGSSTSDPITLEVKYYDAGSGELLRTDIVGPLSSGQSSPTINTLTLGLPSSANAILVVATRTAGSAQFGGWVSVLDTGSSDSSFYLMQ